MKNIEIPEFEGGVQIISPEDFKNIKAQLENVPPVLAFLRTLKPPPESWKPFFFTTANNMEIPNTIRPTDLYKMVETVHRYLLEAERSGVKGIVLVEGGLEYLRIHNEFPSIAKMMSTVRDYIISNKGALIVVIDKNALDEREYMLLRRILE